MKKFCLAGLLLMALALVVGLGVFVSHQGRLNPVQSGEIRLKAENGQGGVQYVFAYPKVANGGHRSQYGLGFDGDKALLYDGVPTIEVKYMGFDAPDIPPEFFPAKELLSNSDRGNGFDWKLTDKQTAAIVKELSVLESKLSDLEMMGVYVFYGELEGREWAVQVVLAGHSSPIGEVRVSPNSGDVIGVPIPAYRPVTIVVSGVPEEVDNAGMVRLQDVGGVHGPIWEPAGGHGPKKGAISIGASLLLDVEYRGEFFPGSQGIRPDETAKGYTFEGVLLKEGDELQLMTTVVDG